MLTTHLSHPLIVFSVTKGLLMNPTPFVFTPFVSPLVHQSRALRPRGHIIASGLPVVSSSLKIGHCNFLSHSNLNKTIFLYVVQILDVRLNVSS